MTPPPHDPIKRRLERVLRSPRAYLFCRGRRRLKAMASEADARKWLYAIKGWQARYAVLLETPLSDVYLQVEGAGVGRRTQTNYEFCMVEEGRLVPFIPAIQGPDRTRLLLKYLRVLAIIAYVERPRGAAQNIKLLRARYHRSMGRTHARLRLEGSQPSRLAHVVIPRGTCGLPS